MPHFRCVKVARLPAPPSPSRNVPYVDIHQFDAATTLLSHLHQQAQGPIALIVGAQPRHTHRETERAYMALCEKSGFAPLLIRADEAGGEDAGFAAMRELAKRGKPFAGVLVSIDAFAFGASKAATSLGIEMPGQLRMATRYDGIYARECSPPLTALNLHLDEVARLGVDLLFDHILGRRDVTRVSGPAAALVRRASSG